MKRYGKLARVGRRLAVMLCGGGLLVLDSCDPTVRQTLLDGIQSASNGLANTFIDAFFQKITADDQTTTGTTST